MWVILLLAGLWLSVRTGFWQFFSFRKIFSETFGKMFSEDKAREKKPGSVSPFQAMSAALASTVGTGNIAGVATAIVAGGPGAVFWMWVSAFLGMMTKYAEVFLAVKHRRQKADGSFYGGPMYYLEDLGWKKPAMLFALLCMLSAFGVGNLTQINTLAEAIHSVFSVPKIITGIATAILAGLVLLGGMKSIGRMTEKLVPVMSVLYIGLSFALLVIFRGNIFPAFQLIFVSAFNPQAAFGGAAGYTIFAAMRYGVNRGIFSNEAGLGSAPIAHATADTDSPARQGMWGAAEVFIDTIILCTLTALVILVSGVFGTSPLDGAALTLSAFETGLGDFGAVAVALSTALFAFAAIPGWCFYGEECCRYLFKNPRVQIFYRAVFICALIPGAILRLEVVWGFSDITNALMAIPNLAALFMLGSSVFLSVREKSPD